MSEEIEPMSKYKWNVLAKLAETHGLGEYFADRATYLSWADCRICPTLASRECRIFC